jgi:hypothetical protein
MPRGPKGERRPADVIGAAVKVMRIATGEEPEDYGGHPRIRGQERGGGCAQAAWEERRGQKACPPASAKRLQKKLQKPDGGIDARRFLDN